MTGRADLVLRGGPIWTAEAAAPEARALAIGGGRILAVGSEDDVEPFVHRGTRVVELAGRFACPGFIDAHVHFLTGGLELAGVKLRDVRSREELARRLGDFAASLEPGAWITGGSWDHENWGGRLPHRSWIDAATPDNPVLVKRLDLHTALANTRALEIAGITAGSPDPAGGTIVRDEDGEPTGVLKDEAIPLVESHVPPPSDAERDRAVDAAVSHALARGVTQLHDMGRWDHLAAYRRARAEDRLGVRIYSVLPMVTGERLAEMVRGEGRGDSRLWWGGLKAFVDGSLGSATAWFHEPYEDEPSNTGLTVTDLPTLRRRIFRADEAGLQAIVHAIGDRANDWLLDVYGEVRSRSGPRDRRFRVEHAQHLTESAIGRFAELDVVASVQPGHAVDDGRWAEAKVGPERVRRTYAFRSLLDAGARMAFGSDWTVAPLDPILGIYAAVTRKTSDGSHPGGWVPEQKVSVEEALRGYTLNGAHAGFVEEETGSLAPGKQADVALLTRDPRAVDPGEISSVEVDMTLVGGTVAYERE